MNRLKDINEDTGDMLIDRVVDKVLKEIRKEGSWILRMSCGKFMKNDSKLGKIRGILRRELKDSRIDKRIVVITRQ